MDTPALLSEIQKGLRAALGDAPGVDQVGVLDLGHARQVGHQVGLQHVADSRQRSSSASSTSRNRGGFRAGVLLDRLPPSDFVMRL